MKKMLFLIITLSVFMLMSVTASAHGWQDDNNRDDNHHRDRHHHYSDDSGWHRTHDNDYRSERDLPFRWHDSYRSMYRQHHLERIYDRDWNDRFPGSHAYRWHNDQGFWHHGHYVTEAVFFYDDNDELISIGYMADGVFIHFREDHESYENHDSFYLSWWRH